MKKIDIVYPSSLSSLIGPSQTITRLKNARDVFFNHGIELNVFDKKTKDFTGKNFLKKKIKNKILGSERLFAIIYLIRFELNRFLFIKDYCKKKRDVDIVVFHHITSFIFFTMLNKNLKVKMILFQHNSGDISKMGKKRFPKIKTYFHIRVIENLFFKKIHLLKKIVFISKYAKNNFNKKNPQFSKKTETIINGIPDIDYKIDYSVNSNETINLITVGTVSTRKGQDIIIKALANLNSKTLSQFRLTVVGEGPELIEFKELALNLRVHENIQFVGKKEQNQVFKFLKKSSVFVLMSHSEGLPLSILEALRFGLPIITSNVDGCPETVSNSNGFIINPDVSELTHVLKKLKCEDLNLMSRKSRELFENDYKFESFLNNYIILMNGV